MYLRHMIDTIIMVGIVALFNIFIISFVAGFVVAQSQADQLLLYNNSGVNRFSDIYQSLNTLLNKSLESTALQHDLVFYTVVAAYLNTPLQFLAKAFFVRKTSRTKIEINSSEYIDLALSLAIIFWLWQKIALSRVDLGNNFQLYGLFDYTSGQNFIFNLIWLIQLDQFQNFTQWSTLTTFRFDYIISIVCVLIWVKLIFQLRYIKVFGSLFIIIKNIILQIMRFLLIWVLEIMVFISFGLLFMGQLP